MGGQPYLRRTAGLSLGLALVLTACSTGPSLPDPEPIDRREVREAEDWKDWGAEENQRRRAESIAGTRLSRAQIDSAMRGRVLRGCYPNGETFAEYLADDGKFYDAARNNAELGVWGMKEDQLCFRYPERAAQDQPDSCFAVYRNGQGYDFYLPDLSAKVASTNCSSGN